MRSAGLKSAPARRADDRFCQKRAHSGRERPPAGEKKAVGEIGVSEGNIKKLGGDIGRNSVEPLCGCGKA